MQYLLENNMASMLIDEGDPLNKTEQELILQEDSEDGLETTENNCYLLISYITTETNTLKNT